MSTYLNILVNFLTDRCNLCKRMVMFRIQKAEDIKLKASGAILKNFVFKKLQLELQQKLFDTFGD